MYLCLCNALTDRQLKQAAADTGSSRPCDVYAACGCRAQCGSCVKAVLSLLREVVPSVTTIQQQGAD